jgi:hypothetical protein
MASQFDVVVAKDLEGFSSQVCRLSLAVTHRDALLMS